MANLMNPRRVLVLALALAAALAGGLLLARDPSANAASSAKTLKLSADAKGKLKFSTTKLTTTHGKVTLVMTNPGGSGKPHAIAVEGKGVDKDGKVASPGKTSTVTATLKKGTYQFYCPVDGHRAAGMKGTLVVR
jgi:plastocyanin